MKQNLVWNLTWICLCLDSHPCQCMLECSVSVLWFVCFCLAFLDAQLSLATSCVRRLKWNEAVDKVGFSVGWGVGGLGGFTLVLNLQLRMIRCNLIKKNTCAHVEVMIEIQEHASIHRQTSRYVHAITKCHNGGSLCFVTNSKIRSSSCLYYCK